MCYSRISTDEQNAKSIEAQESETERNAKTLGATKVIHFKGIGISGKTDKRLGFQRAIAYAIENGAKFFVVHKLDRFSRNRDNMAKYRSILEAEGIKLCSVSEN
ncbi:recombinase family protein [Fusibacter sp. JL216-2]|uniref:recombinase family protein n=1 Tax=Fusibacter sp. JL216-2 TaxID=3071453 RepID=UPI003D32F597